MGDKAPPDREALAVLDGKKTLGRYLQHGRLRVALEEDDRASTELWFCINGRLDRAFFRHASRRLTAMLRDTKSLLVVQIERFDARELDLLKGMLDRLVRYRDRIKIAADDTSRSIIGIDSSVFTLVLRPVPASTQGGDRARD